MIAKFLTMFLSLSLCTIACDDPSDQEKASTTSIEQTDGGSVTGGMGSGTGMETESNVESDASTTGEVEITECPTSGGDWEPTQEFPDASGWEEVIVRGIYLRSTFEAYPFTLFPCKDISLDRGWCVYWNTRPLRGVECRSNIQIKGRLSQILPLDEQCGTPFGQTFDRALIIDEVLDVGPCTLGNCDAEIEESCMVGPFKKNCKWPCKETNIDMETGTSTGTGTETSSGTSTETSTETGH